MKKVIKLYNLIQTLNVEDINEIKECIINSIDFKYGINLCMSWNHYFRLPYFHIQKRFNINIINKYNRKDKLIKIVINDMECIYLLEIIMGNYIK